MNQESIAQLCDEEEVVNSLDRLVRVPFSHPRIIFFNNVGFKGLVLTDIRSLYILCFKPGFHIIVSVVRIVSAPANDPDDYMETQFDAIQTILATETTRSSR